MTITLKTDRGERSVEGTVFEPNSLRLVSVRDVKVEAPLGGTMLIIANDDQPGVIGEVGTILGRHKVNIANFALGRNDRGAVGVVNVDEEADSPGVLADALAELRKVRAVREAWVDQVAEDLVQDDRGAYVNFVGDEGGARVRAAYPGLTWNRLARVKRQYDPANVFRLNQNVPPAELR